MVGMTWGHILQALEIVGSFTERLMILQGENFSNLIH